MPPSTTKYQCYNSFLLRIPLLPIVFFRDLTSIESIHKKKLISLFNDKIINESIYLASPDLYQQIIFWKEGKITDSKKQKRIKISFLKYLSRMSSRCTPFGLFAGCTVGGYSHETCLNIDKYESFNRKTRLDMDYVTNIYRYVLKLPNIKNNIRWYPNNTLYKVGDHYRYIQYISNDNGRKYSLEGVKAFKCLDLLLQEAEKGVRISEFVEILTRQGFNNLESCNFIDELIDNQIITSEYEPTLSGIPYHLKLFKLINTGKAGKKLDKNLGKLQKQIGLLDKSLGNSIEKYDKIISLADGIGIPYTKKHLLQTDMFPKMTTTHLNHNWKRKLRDVLCFLNKITLHTSSTDLSKFKTRFLNRYEGEEVPLTEALDTEMGIGYQHVNLNSNQTYLIDQVIIPNKKLSNKKLHWDTITQVLNKKIQHHKKTPFIVELEDNDFPDLNPNWNNLPDTMSCLAELLLIDNKEMMYVNSIFGSSAAKLMSRFYHGNSEVHSLINEISKKEESLNTDKIVAEIIHLPEERTGNVILRPKLRKYEIPYLANSNLNLEQQIPVTDLLISVKDNRIILRSKKLNKEVLPYLTNAHNYKNSSLPIYQFLCEVGLQSKRQSIGFDWGALSEIYYFLPRVVYRDFILAKAIWKIDVSDFKKIIDDDKGHMSLKDKLKTWREDYQIPDWVQLIDGDNTLTLNLNNNDCIEMLLQTIKRKRSFVLEEFLFHNKGVVKNHNNEYYSNQMVLCFYKSFYK
ncbi:lantibiotic dehydratase family protein [Galbibacter sp. EGI 63066]|uniref:lantibiotic dehydratase family protein n=1 Tax=Galbibacter sp. EGI 63066 TaxID=2993559 RepID=UPI002248BD20|nr:lantibiotic dehydratase family protein [Galbibacter sp. EGI 63066]MCX2678900.1 lantibiotic dehydratase family protein [Galbibacter sp. EGI 63066]